MESNSITMSNVLIATIVTLIVAIVIRVAIEVMAHKKTPAPKQVRALATIALAVISTFSVAFAVICAIAFSHGMYDLDVDATKILKSIEFSPTDQSNEFARAIGYSEGETPTTVKSSFVVIYRFTCPDCEQTHHELESKLRAEGKPYWFISSRSDVGHALCNLYGINEVPSIIAYDSQGRASAGVIYQREGDDIQLNDSAWKIAVRHANN